MRGRLLSGLTVVLATSTESRRSDYSDYLFYTHKIAGTATTKFTFTDTNEDQVDIDNYGNEEKMSARITCQDMLL